MSPRSRTLSPSKAFVRASNLPKDVERGGIDAAHVAYAQARRPRMSWQAIAQQLGVSAPSLQRAVEAAEAAPRAVAAPDPKGRAGDPPAPSPGVLVVPGSITAMAFLAIADGVRRRSDLAYRVGVSAEACAGFVERFRARGLIERGSWELTLLGKRHAAWLRSCR